MALILDTNALSAFADGDEGLGAQLATVKELFLPVIVLGEYRFGVRQSRHREAYEAWLDQVLPELQVLPVIEQTTAHYAATCDELKTAGTPIPTNDVWIAAMCREHNLPVVSRDAHFDVVRDLRRLTW